MSPNSEYGIRTAEYPEFRISLPVLFPPENVYP
jgi:hypothetical protein